MLPDTISSQLSNLQPNLTLIFGLQHLVTLPEVGLFLQGTQMGR